MADVALEMKKNNLKTVGRFLTAIVEGSPPGSVRRKAVMGAAASIQAHFYTHAALSNPESTLAMTAPCVQSVNEIPTAQIQNVSLVDGRGRSALWYAADLGDVSLLTHLIVRGADVNLADRQAVYPLHAAVYSMRFEIVQMLLSNGADVNAMDHVGLTPLSKVFHADVADCKRDDKAELVKMAKLLVDRGACIAALGLTKIRQYGAGSYVDSKWG